MIRKVLLCSVFLVGVSDVNASEEIEGDVWQQKVAAGEDIVPMLEGGVKGWGEFFDFLQTKRTDWGLSDYVSYLERINPECLSSALNIPYFPSDNAQSNSVMRDPHVIPDLICNFYSRLRKFEQVKRLEAALAQADEAGYFVIPSNLGQYLVNIGYSELKAFREKGLVTQDNFDLIYFDGQSLKGHLISRRILGAYAARDYSYFSLEYIQDHLRKAELEWERKISQLEESAVFDSDDESDETGQPLVSVRSRENLGGIMASLFSDESFSSGSDSDSDE